MLAILPLQILQHPNPARGGAAPGRSGFQRHALLFRLCGFFDLDDVQTRWQRLLQFVGFLWVIEGECVKVS